MLIYLGFADAVTPYEYVVEYVFGTLYKMDGIIKPVGWTHSAVWAHPTGFIIPSGPFTDANVYGTGSVKIWKTRHRISVNVRIFLQCTSTSSRRARGFRSSPTV